MSTQNGQKPCPHCTADHATKDESKNNPPLTTAQKELLEYCHALEAPDLVKALKLLHDIAIYDSHVFIGQEEKDALFSVKGLWECIEGIRVES
ncbi:hypothetical protein [Flagellimonas onchidii]|uniref:hypothetical protein n=1 Tax=Flagellimonas onchidii TaxID=2562684 RepID=UPI0010A64B4B|nr:hypothetical protein [Allomuricauda onchidii]